LNTPSTPVQTNPLLGCLAAIAVVLIWSTWLVASRSGAQSTLTIYDMAVLRYGVSAVVALPFVLYFKPWQSMSVRRITILTILLSPIYTLTVFSGFSYAPAAHGGIFMNGALPAITLLAGWIWLSESPNAQQLLGVVLIIAGACLAVADASQLSLAGSWFGDLLFLISAVFFSGYLILAKLWQISTTQVLLCNSVTNAIFYVPVWFFALPSGFSTATQTQIIVQTLYQGLIPGLVGMLLVALAVRNIGSAATAAFMAAVPGMGTVLSLIFLGEVPGYLGWLSLAVLTPGIVLVAQFWKRSS
jgi:drug/metabolite transporter (DMT)-like permease